MLIDVKELSKLLPESRSLSMSIKKGKGEKLDVLFRVKHELAQLKNTFSRGADDAKQIDAATKLLDQPYAFSATAEELNVSFEEKIKQPVESTRSLVEVITDRTKSGDTVTYTSTLFNRIVVRMTGWFKDILNKR